MNKLIRKLLEAYLKRIESTAARMSDKTYTAEELRSNKTQAMALAYSGETVKITNVRFPGGHFELRFVKPEPIEKPEEKD